MDRCQVERNDGFDQAQDELDKQGAGSLRCAVDGKEMALLAVEDSLRPDAAKLISDLKQEGMQLTMISGDRRHAAEALAQRLGGMEVLAEVLPEDKDSEIKKLQEGGHRVAMVGDGVNDAPAMVRSDVGIALGSGTDVSIASADIVLVGSELKDVRLASELSKRTLRTIRQNIGIAFMYNIIMVPLAMAGFITPLIAAVSMPINSLLVIGNAARIRSMFGEK
jgi:Cu2+-exporting ATPase